MDAQLGQRNWPHTGRHARAELDAPVSRRAASGGDSDCRVSRCLEQDGSQGDLERKEEPGDDDVLAAVRLACWVRLYKDQQCCRGQALLHAHFQI